MTETQTEARARAKELTAATGQIHVAEQFPLGSWGGQGTHYVVTDLSTGKQVPVLQPSPEYLRLKAAHAAAQAAGQDSITGPTDREIVAEQDAWDRLVDYVDSTEGYTWSHLDPRGTRAEHEATR